jgi:hypothetical protein
MRPVLWTTASSWRAWSRLLFVSDRLASSSAVRGSGRAQGSFQNTGPKAIALAPAMLFRLVRVPGDELGDPEDERDFDSDEERETHDDQHYGVPRHSFSGLVSRREPGLLRPPFGPVEQGVGAFHKVALIVAQRRARDHEHLVPS